MPKWYSKFYVVCKTCQTHYKSFKTFLCERIGNYVIILAAEFLAMRIKIKNNLFRKSWRLKIRIAYHNFAESITVRTVFFFFLASFAVLRWKPNNLRYLILSDCGALKRKIALWPYLIYTFPNFFSTGIRFLGCSEAKYQHDYGCDKELQNVDVKDKSEKKIKVFKLF